MLALSTRGDPTVLAQPAVTWKRVMREGVTVGMLGASAVAAWFLLLDAMAGKPFRTPALLRGVLFHGVTDPFHPAVTPAVVLQYTVVHGVVFLISGLIVAGLLALADREPRLLIGLVMLFCCFEVFVVGADDEGCPQTGGLSHPHKPARAALTCRRLVSIRGDSSSSRPTA